MSDDPTPSPAPGAVEGWGKGAASASEPQHQSSTGSQEEAQIPAEAAQSPVEEAHSPTEAAQSPAETAQPSTEAAPSPAETAQPSAEAARSSLEQPQSPADDEPSPVGQAQIPSEGPAGARPPAEHRQDLEEAFAGTQPEAQPATSPANAAPDDAAGPPAETPTPADTGPDEESLRLAEALVFAAAAPVSARALSQLLPDTMDADAVIAALRDRYAGRGVELVETAGGVQFRTAPDLAPRLRKVIEVPRKLPRVAMETLAIIAYHQPCTRAEIEEIRGTSLSQQTLDALLEANLVAPKGRREVPGRPTLWGTTPQFLAQFGLKDIRDLPQRGDLLLEPPKPSGVSDAPPLTPDFPEPPADGPPAGETGSAALSQG